MPSYTSFIQAALATLKEPDNCLTLAISSSSGHELQSNVTVQKSQSRFSTQPVRQIAQGAERQADIIEEKTAESESAEFTKPAETAESKNIIEEKIELTESAETEATTEVFKESTKAFDVNIESRKMKAKKHSSPQRPKLPRKILKKVSFRSIRRR